jgi:hypothetical protein
VHDEGTDIVESQLGKAFQSNTNWLPTNQVKGRGERTQML